MSGQQIAVSADAFGQFRVKEMKEGDMWLGSATPTAIKSQKCHIILFYEPVTTDPALISIWNALAQDIAGPVIAGVNTSARGEIMDAFLSVEADLDNPLNWASGFGVPTILVYRNRWPQAFYNGELSYDAIKKWILILACKPGYREHSSLFHGVRAVEPDVFVSEQRIENFPYPTSSRDFTSMTGEGGDGTRGRAYYPEEGGYEEGDFSGEEGFDEFYEEGGYEEEEEEASRGGFVEEPTDVGFL